MSGKLLDEAFKLDHAKQAEPAKAKYLEAVVQILDFCRQKETKLGTQEFGNYLRLVNDCLNRVWELHVDQCNKSDASGLKQYAILQNRQSTASSSSSTTGSFDASQNRYSTVGPNDPVSIALDHNRRLVRQYEENAYRKKRESSTSSLEQKLALERKQEENLFLAKETIRKSTVIQGNEQNRLSSPSPRQKLDFSSSIKTVSAAINGLGQEKRGSNGTATVRGVAPSTSSSSIASAGANSILAKYAKLVAEDCDLDAESYPSNRLPLLEEFFDSRAIRCLSESEKKRQAAVLELIYTEQTHVRNLKILAKLFKAPLVENQILPSNFVYPYLPMTLVDLLFSNLDEVIAVHNEFNTALKQLSKDRQPIFHIGRTLIQYFDGPFAERFVTTVSKFCRHQQYAIHQLAQRRKQDLRFCTFLEEIESLPVCRGLKLDAMLPAEAQRIIKYQLMFKRLLDSESKDTDEYERLQRCLNSAKQMAAILDAEKHGYECAQKLAELQYRLDGGNVEADNAQSDFNLRNCVYVFDGRLVLRQVNSTIDVHCVLLEGLLLILTKASQDGYRLRLGVPQTSLNGVITLSTAALKDDLKSANTFYVVSGIGTHIQVYNLEAESPAEKERWYSYLCQEIDKATVVKRTNSPTLSISNIKRSLSIIEYTDDAAFDEFSDDDEYREN